MRTRCVCWGVFTMMLLAGMGRAQTPASPQSYPAEMTIIVPEVEVRSGPTKQHYATAKLKQGDRVTVVRDCKDQPGWSAIKPPPGSFSWIREKYVKRVDPRNGFVEAPANGPVAVMPASLAPQQSLNVESAKVPSGSLVVVMDKPYNCDGENWLPIQPTPEEVRYLPTSALRPPAAAVTVAAGFPTTVGGDVMAKADEAYRAGNLDLARQLYRQAADKASEPAKSYALNRLATLSPGSAGAVSMHSNWQPIGGQPIAATTPTSTPIGVLPIGTLPTTAAPPAGQTTSNYTVPPVGMTLMKPAQWSEWGYLRKAGFERDGQAVYVLENNQGRPLIYAVEQPGVRPVLSKMIGRPVCLYGPVAYRSGEVPRMDYMIASHYATP